jgi:hypothetical protein
MHCPSCNARISENDLYCQRCGAELTPTASSTSEQSTSIVPVQTNLPALLYNSPLPRNVAAGVGALAFGVGIELLRRNLLGRLQKRGVASALPALADMKDLLGQHTVSRSNKLPKGYEVQESIYVVRRVIRRG